MISINQGLLIFLSLEVWLSHGYTFNMRMRTAGSRRLNYSPDDFDVSFDTEEINEINEIEIETTSAEPIHSTTTTSTIITEETVPVTETLDDLDDFYIDSSSQHTHNIDIEGGNGKSYNDRIDEEATESWEPPPPLPTSIPISELRCYSTRQLASLCRSIAKNIDKAYKARFGSSGKTIQWGDIRRAYERPRSQRWSADKREEAKRVFLKNNLLKLLANRGLESTQLLRVLDINWDRIGGVSASIGLTISTTGTTVTIPIGEDGGFSLETDGVGVGIDDDVVEVEAITTNTINTSSGSGSVGIGSSEISGVCSMDKTCNDDAVSSFNNFIDYSITSSGSVSSDSDSNNDNSIEVSSNDNNDSTTTTASTTTAVYNEYGGLIFPPMDIKAFMKNRWNNCISEGMSSGDINNELLRIFDDLEEVLIASPRLLNDLEKRYGASPNGYKKRNQSKNMNLKNNKNMKNNLSRSSAYGSSGSSANSGATYTGGKKSWSSRTSRARHSNRKSNVSPEYSNSSGHRISSSNSGGKRGSSGSDGDDLLAPKSPEQLKQEEAEAMNWMASIIAAEEE